MVFLIVDDCSADLEVAYTFVQGSGHEVKTASSYEKALQILDAEESIDVLLTDIHLTETAKDEVPKGLLLTSVARRKYPALLTISMSSDPSEKLFDKALAYGAYQFLRKPLSKWDEIGIALSLAERRRDAELQKGQQLIKLPAHLQKKYPDGIVVSDEIRQQIEGAATFPQHPVVIQGETGTGKEEVAKLIHKFRLSRHGTLPFVAVNCAHLRSDLAHSKLFGHKKGSFTGATADSKGYIEEADGGILFLDEIHTLSIECQQDLLRVLNDGSYQRLGETRNRISKFQVIVASTVTLDEGVERGQIILDLRTRLAGFEMVLKPLRERCEDMADLVQVFLASRNAYMNETELNRLVHRCQSYYWQGNIRLLFQALSMMLTQATLKRRSPTFEDMPYFAMMDPPKSELFSPKLATPTLGGSPLQKGSGSTQAACVQPAAERDAHTLPAEKRIDDPSWILDQAEPAIERLLVGQSSLQETLRSIERSILSQMVGHGLRVGELVARLGISRSSLSAKRREYKLNN